MRCLLWRIYLLSLAAWAARKIAKLRGNPMKRLLLALGLAAALCSPAAAYTGVITCSFGRSAAGIPTCRTLLAQAQTPPVVATPPHGPIGDPDAGKIGTPNIIVHQAPPPAATIDTGTIAGQIITWVIAVFGPVIAGFLVLLLKRLATRAGVEVDQAASDRLDEIMLNALHAGAQQAGAALAGRGGVAVQNQVLMRAVEYVQRHGADTLKTLGVDPTDPRTVEALRARAAKLVADATKPTPPVLDSAPPGEPAAPAAGPSGAGPRAR